MGWLSAIGSIFSWLGKEGIAQSLVRIVVGMAAMRLLAPKQNDTGGAGSATPEGIRQQIQPATGNKIPVAYGDSYFGGTVVDVQLVNDNKELYAVIALCETTGDLFSTNENTPIGRTPSLITIDNIYLNSSRITFKADGTTIDYVTDDSGVVDTNPSGLVGIYLYQGDSNSPMLPCQPGTSTPISGTLPAVAYSVMPGWTASHTMQNIVFAVVKMLYEPQKGQRSIPNLKFHVRNTLNKPGDVLHDYMTNSLYGAGIPEALINNPTFSSLNSYSAESVTYAPFPAQTRYKIDGLIRTSESVMSNMQKIVAAAGSNITYDISTGKWSVIINKTQTKTLEFNDSNILGQVVINGTSLDSYFNSVEVQFPYSYLKDQMNFIRVDLPTAMRNDNESDNMLQLSHELVNNVVQAHLLGNIDLRQSREDISVVFNTDYTKFNTQVGDVIGITNSVYGWTSKEFRVIRVKKNESDNGELTLEISAIAYNADVYTVEPISDFTPLIGPGHSIPNLGAIATPIAPTVTSSTISSQPSISITGTVPVGVVTEMEYWYTKDANPDDNLRNYTLLGSMRAENSAAFETGVTSTFKTVLLSSGNYYFKVRAVNDTGSSKFSPPSTTLAYTYVQATDALPSTAAILDANGNQIMDGSSAMNVGMLAYLLSKMFDWGDIANMLPSEIADFFGITQGDVDTVNGATGTGNPVEILSEGELITSAVKQIDFVGDGVIVSAVGDNVTVTIGGAGTDPGGGGTIPPPETYGFTLIASRSSITEGQAVTFTLTTSSTIADGTLIPYTITGVTSEDVASGDRSKLSGNFTMNSKIGEVTIDTVTDSITEYETMTLTLDQYPSVKAKVVINEYSSTPGITAINLYFSKSTVLEGETIVATYYNPTLTQASYPFTAPTYTITGVTSSDLSNVPLTGRFPTINSGFYSHKTFTVTADDIVEGEVMTMTSAGLTVTALIQDAESNPVEPLVFSHGSFFYPPNRETWGDPITGVGGAPDNAPATGMYYIKFEGITRHGLEYPLYGAVVKGTGDARLYKSNGTLVSTISASSLVIDKNLVGFPFPDREDGTDYYVLMDEGIVKYCTNGKSPAITSKYDWNFNTPVRRIPPYAGLVGDDFALEDIPDLVLTGYSPNGNSCAQDIRLTFNNNITRGTGGIRIRQVSNNALIYTFTEDNISVSIDTLICTGYVSSVTSNVEYAIEADLGAAMTDPEDCHLDPIPSVAFTNKTFTPSKLVHVHTVAYNIAGEIASDRCSRQSNINVTFNKPIGFGPSGFIHIYDYTGALHQSFDVADAITESSDGNRTAELLLIRNYDVPLNDLGNLIINPTKDLNTALKYYVLIDANAIWDINCDVGFEGISDTNQATFTTKHYLSEKLTSNPGESKTQFYYNEPTAIYGLTNKVIPDILPGAGKLNVYDEAGTKLLTLNSNDPAITYST